MKLLIPIIMALSFSAVASDIYKTAEFSLGCVSLSDTRLVMDTIQYNTEDNAVTLIDYMVENGDCITLRQGILFKLVDIDGSYYRGAWLSDTSVRLWFHRGTLNQ